MFQAPFDDARENVAANTGAPQGSPGHIPQPPAPPPPAKPRFTRWRIARWALSALLLLFLIAIAWLAIAAPPSRTLRPIAPPSVTLLASNGSLISRRGAVTDSPVDVRQLPPHVSEAFLAIEDRRFYHHIGVDPRGIARAAWHDARAGRMQEGGSTITQQLAKLVYLSSDRTAARKLREMMIAMWLEAWLSKAYGPGTGIVREQIRKLFLGETRLQQAEIEVTTADGERRNWIFTASAPGTVTVRSSVVGSAQPTCWRRA